MKIKLFVMDVDGTMTDGRFTLDSLGNETKTFNVKDGTAINLLKKYNVMTAVITGRNSEIVKKRCQKLRIDYYFVTDKKLKKLISLTKSLKISLKEVSYIGDDINDLEIFNAVGFKACPKDACNEIKAKANFICKLKGGYGVVREYTDYLIKNNLLA